MEKGLSEGETLLAQLFPAKAEDIGQYSPLTLAYIGDAAYELIVRSLLLRQCAGAKAAPASQPAGQSAGSGSDDPPAFAAGLFVGGGRSCL